jgi:hypothetical protein
VWRETRQRVHVFGVYGIDGEGPEAVDGIGAWIVLRSGRDECVDDSGNREWMRCMITSSKSEEY